jgi:mRNA degradation ribonuclease J1/J2
MAISDDKSPVIPEILDEDTVRIITVSGVEEIGRNMNIIETKDDIIVIDAGFQRSHDSMIERCVVTALPSQANFHEQ